ncbi:MAG TPA: histidine phosphatase family protein [Myxococcota bacterium]|nr:histidine phosphatase family protein [Myxococcota bacterium]
MKLYLIRHAKAESRASWWHEDVLRPLSAAGHSEAMGLVERLDGVPLARVISSPALRCRQTVEPLASRFGLPVEIDPRLGEGSSMGDAMSLIQSLGNRPVALCSHGDLIPGLVERLWPGALELEGGGGVPKGATWVFQGTLGDTLRVAYLPPPKHAFGTGAEGERVRVGVADLGSTSFHVMVADATPDGHLERVAREREMLRLGAAIGPDGLIPPETCERAVDAARRLGRAAQRAGAEQMHAIATAALRDARNGRKLAEQLGRALGTNVRILSGQEEARLIFSAFRRRVGLGTEPALGLDLGGGSLELAVGNAQHLRFEETLRLGVTRLQSELAPSDPMTGGEARALRQRVEDSLAPLVSRVKALAPVRCIAAGGTARALGRLLLEEENGALRGLLVSADQLEKLASRLRRSSHEERLDMVGIDSRRADLLPTGALILSTVLQSLGLPGMMISDWGIREGVILAAIARRERDHRKKRAAAAG